MRDGAGRQLKAGKYQRLQSAERGIDRRTGFTVGSNRQEDGRDAGKGRGGGR